MFKLEKKFIKVQLIHGKIMKKYLGEVFKRFAKLI